MSFAYSKKTPMPQQPKNVRTNRKGLALNSSNEASLMSICSNGSSNASVRHRAARKRFGSGNQEIYSKGEKAAGGGLGSNNSS